MSLPLKEALIIDLDGTLCDNKTKFYAMQMADPNWDDISRMAQFDVVNWWCLEIICKFASRYKIIFLTARSENQRLITENWLTTNVNAYVDYELIMRPEGDSRRDNEVKLDLYLQHISGKYEILFAIDDRGPVVQMWRDLGIVCLQCEDH